MEYKGPCVLTCSKHNDGTKLFMVHSCWRKENLPEKYSINCSKQSYNLAYWNQWKHQNIQPDFKYSIKPGTFNGIYTCSSMIFTEFDFRYILSAEAKSRSITNLPAINAHLRKIRQEKIIYEYVESGKRQFSIQLSSTINHLKYIKGDTLVNIEVSIIFKTKLQTDKCECYLTI